MNWFKASSKPQDLPPPLPVIPPKPVSDSQLPAAPTLPEPQAWLKSLCSKPAGLSASLMN